MKWVQKRGCSYPFFNTQRRLAKGTKSLGEGEGPQPTWTSTNYQDGLSRDTCDTPTHMRNNLWQDERGNLNAE